MYIKGHTYVHVYKGRVGDYGTHPNSLMVSVVNNGSKPGRTKIETSKTRGNWLCEKTSTAMVFPMVNVL